VLQALGFTRINRKINLDLHHRMITHFLLLLVLPLLSLTKSPFPELAFPACPANYTKGDLYVDFERGSPTWLSYQYKCWDDYMTFVGCRTPNGSVIANWDTGFFSYGSEYMVWYINCTSYWPMDKREWIEPSFYLKLKVEGCIYKNIVYSLMGTFEEVRGLNSR
ncbi:hypothetical protein PENTCL1PPCAC_18542, partial [Pristionchus entomophagus]